MAGYYPFDGTKITSISLPNITQLGHYIGVGLSAVWEIGTKLETVEIYTFRCITGTKRNSTYLINTTTPPSLASSGTVSAASFQGYIYVPDESYDDYIASSAWSPIKVRIKRMSEYTG